MNGRVAAVPLSILQALVGHILVAGGFIVLGVHIYRQYTGTGVASLSGYAITFGASLIGSHVWFIILHLHGQPIDKWWSSTAAVLGPDTPQWLGFLLFGSIFLNHLNTVYMVLWGLFVFSYTTRLSQRHKLGLLFIGGYGVLVGLPRTIEAMGLWEPTGMAFRLSGVFYSFEILLMGGLLILAIIQLYRTTKRVRPFTRGIFGSISGSILFPLFVPIIQTFGAISVSREFILLFLLMSLLGLGCLWVAVSRYRIFDQLPAARAAGRETALGSLETAVVVFDKDRYVTDLNAAAERLFETDATDAVGASLPVLLPARDASDAVWRKGRATVQFPERDLILEAETTISTDEQGRELGRTIVFYDVTEERRRQQRIQVLNRVLRHNLRNELEVVSGYSQLFTDGGVGTAEYAEKMDAQVTELVGLGDTAREIEKILGADRRGGEPTALKTLIEDAIATIEVDADASITRNVPPDAAVHANPTILQPVVRELVENAVEHNETGSPEVNVMVRSAGAQIVISDNGPGMPEYEIAVFESGHETPLEHGSGLGLWLVKWGLDRLGGTVSFDTDAGGTRVTITLPESLVET